ncbi:energy-coupled thiamine transporter ThiT [Ruminococcus sp. YE282]|uniref:energy-coupled thiamine transporter ThiT n=1 Tax=Ruminococcus sp. YE282 TaxID=3158780 RepID=UPI0008805335|nr:energy-coupled thiamine transporter ThiT [Ruminococcus bromii]MEE3499595.1 energy-coupled thiamine transporter ThiT [Ruminococcus bromii]SCY75508.1 thiamine transporter [Ruminococcus bromii]
MKNVKLLQKMTESAVMIALATILSLIKVIDMPYGGSVTFASMLPLIIIAYRYGFPWGALTGFVYGLVQMLFGLNNLSYATSFGAAIAIILLDYLFAFAATSLGAVFRKMENAPTAMGCGALFACVVRYIFHVISGCTVWAGVSIPSSDGLVYSLAYNATYMLPETIITVIAAVYIALVIDFSKPKIAAAKKSDIPTASYILSGIAGLVLLAAITAVSILVFPNLQDAETGDFAITGIANTNFTALLIVAIVAIVIIAALLIAKKVLTSNSNKSKNA